MIDGGYGITGDGEIDEQEATDAINYMIENDLMTDSKWSWKIIWNS